MKKVTLTLLILCICLALAGCSHEHSYESMWSIGIENHWHSCEKCDEMIDFAPHIFGEDGTCTVCTAGIYDAENGLKEARAYDDHDTLVLLIKYDSEGNQQSDERYAYEYYDDGNVKNKKIYRDRVLVEEENYQYCTDPENGVTYLAETFTYYIDVATVKNEYNEYNHLLKTLTIDSNGEVYSVDRYEYEFDADGNRTRLSIYRNDGLIRVVDDVAHIMYDYDANGYIQLQRTYVYADDGSLIKEIIHTYGELDHESHYDVTEDGVLYVYKTVYFNEDGTVEEERYYDSNGKEIK
jgi:hypothetical protein